MYIRTAVDLTKAQGGFAETTLETEGGNAALRIGLDRFSPLPMASPIALDLLTVASVVYAADQLVARRTERDGWTRSFEVTIPVRDRKRWRAVSQALGHCVGFLTGDAWKFSFEQLDGSPARIGRKRGDPPTPDASAVCLFSGGLDSLVGAIDWLATHDRGNVMLVGHHDKSGRVQADQKRLVDALRQHRPAFAPRLHPRHVPVWQSAEACDINYRSRSFLFLSLGVYAADALGRNVPVIMPENGAIAVNVPLTPSRRGSCSTRTAHPYFVQQYQSLLRSLGLQHPVENPFILSTKGEVLANCRDAGLLTLAYPQSVSCAKSSRRQHWIRRDVNHCGHCMPCIYRRAALHRAGLMGECYGRDVLAGEIDLDGGAGHGNDFRALFAFLGRGLDRNQIASLLLSSSTFGTADVQQHAAVVERAMDEIRAWLRDCAPQDIRRRAGV